jgi:uncharacterized protein with von Willebrand factor type A (vWA) domain
MIDNELISRQTSLSANIVMFCRYLRTQGFKIGPQEEADALTALSLVYLDNPVSFRYSLQAILVKNRNQQDQFESLYKKYWEELEKAIDSKVTEGNPEPQNKLGNQTTLQSLKDWLYGQANSENIDLATYSPSEIFTQKDFAEFKQSDLDVFRDWITKLKRKLAQSIHRRLANTLKIRRLDIRRTLRASLRKGGEVSDLFFKFRKEKPVKLVILCDVSKSMDLYSRFFLEFMYALQLYYGRLETFVFGTQLQRVTEALQNQEILLGLKKLANEVNQWSGGTQIGYCLNEFCLNYAIKLLDKNTVFIILSDGWDTGDSDLLTEALQKIKKKTAKIIWLNPLAGSPDFQPTVKGMEAALPYLDILAPAHNLESLEKVLPYFKI